MKKTKYFQNCLGVFQGGGCRASAYVGAYKEAMDWGVSFSELVGTSAGAIVAVLIGAGATPEDLEKIIDELDFKSFLRKPQKITSYKPPIGSSLLKYIPYKNISKYYPIITRLGLYDSSKIGEWVEEKLSQLLPDKSSPIKFKDLLIPTNVIVTDIRTKQVEIYNQDNNSNYDVAKAVQCSCNIPLFFQPIDNRYIDGGVLSNLPSFIYENSEKKTYNKILAFSLIADKSNINQTIKSLKDYGKALINTLIDGNLDLQLSLQDDVHIIKINTGKIEATDFDSITTEDLTRLKESGIVATRYFFNHEIGYIKTRSNDINVLKNQFETFNKIIQLLEYKYEEIIILDSDNEWAYTIFPTLLRWNLDNTKIYFLHDDTKDTKKEEHTKYRNRLLEYIGVTIIKTSNIPFDGFIFDGGKIDNCRAIILNSDNDRFHSKYYHGEEDFPLINFIRNYYQQSLNVNNPNHVLQIESIDLSKIKKELKKVSQYNNNNIKITLESIPINDVTFLTKYIKGYKYRQIEVLFNIYNDNDIPLFNPAELKLKDGKTSIIIPPIIEKNNSHYYLIEGNTRFLYAQNNKIDHLNCIVIERVSVLLPSSGRYKIKEILITDKDTRGGQRYENFDPTTYRRIEAAVRNPITTLK